MADSLVDMVMGVIDPDVVTKLAGGIGVDATTTQNIVNSAIPGILGGIASTAATADGAKRISDAVGSMDMSIMDKLGAVAGTSGQATVAADGNRLLGSLIGGGKLDAIANSVAGASATTPAAVKSVMGYLTPAIMGVVGQQDPSNWSDGSSLMNFMAAQKGAIAAAMPAGLAAAVGGATAMAGRASQAAGNVAASIPSMPSRPAATASAGAPSEDGIPSWVWIVLGLVILGALGWYFTRPSAPKVAEKPAMVAEAAKPAAPAPAPDAAAPAPAAKPAVPAAPVVVPAAPAAAPAVVPAAPAAVPAPPAVPAMPVVDVAAMGKQATAALDGVKTALGSITDAASATAALPKLKDATDQLDKVSGLAAALPADAKKTLAGAIAPALPELNTQMDKALALPGVGVILKGPVDAVRAKLTALAGN